MNKNVRRLTLAAALGLAIAGSNALAEEMEEVVVKGDLGSLPGERWAHETALGRSLALGARRSRLLALVLRGQ